MSSVDQIFDGALDSLRERYVSRLPASMAELNKFAVLCDFGEVTAETAIAIGCLAHKLTGSGQTLGFPLISSSAAILEQLLEAGARFGDAAAKAARVLARACETAGQPPPFTENPRDRKPLEAPDENSNAETSALPRLVVLQADPAIARILADVFANRATLLNCQTRAETLEVLRAGDADLLLVDLDNPECAADGLTALLGKAGEVSIPVVALAAQRRSAAIVHALSDGKIECVLKPLDPPTLYRKLFEVLERQRLIAVICDDDRIVREFLKPRFESNGFQVLLANDGDEVLELARRIHPSIIVLDRSTPKLEGLVVLRMLKAEPATHAIPVLMLSSKAQPHEIMECLRSGAAAYMVKPFAPKAVVAKCLEVLGVPNSPAA